MLVLVLSALVGYVIADDISIEATTDIEINRTSITTEPANGTISFLDNPRNITFNGTDYKDRNAAPADNFSWCVNNWCSPNSSDSKYNHTFTMPGVFPVSFFAENQTWNTLYPENRAWDMKSIPNYSVVVTVPIVGNFTNVTVSPFVKRFTYIHETGLNRGIPDQFNWTFYNSTAPTIPFYVNNTTSPIITYQFPVLETNQTYRVDVTASNNSFILNKKWVVDNFSSNNVDVNTTTLLLANFTAVQESCPAFPVDVQFRDNSTGFMTVDKELWDFNDSTVQLVDPSTKSILTHQYHLPGNYSVNYTAINNTYQYQNSTRAYVNVTGLLANFTYTMDPPSGEFWPGQGVTVFFNDTSVGTPATFEWNYGDGKTDPKVYDRNTSHYYSVAGTYNVSFTVFKLCGDTQISNKTTKSITITERLKANFTYQPTSGTYPLKVQFTDTSSDTPRQWAWTFYDKDGVTKLNETTGIQNPSFTYPSAGTYFVDLRVISARGESAMTGPVPVTLYEGVNAGFTADKTKGIFPLLVTFTDTSTPAGQVTNWNWTFGDGADVVRTQAANHTYTRKGNFTVSLTAGNSQTSDTETKGGYISVGTQITPAFTPIGQVPVRAPFIVNFTDASTPADEVSGWQWSFSDGGSASGRTVSHQFPATGLYNVTLNVSSYWDTRTTTGQVNITEINEPVADFVFSPLTVNAGESVRFEDRSYGPGPLNWSWQFGDGGFVSSQSPEYVYQYAGRYYPVLTVTNPYGSNTKNSTIPVSVRGQVIPSFITDKPDWWAVINQPVRFIDTSKGQPVSWVWDFADGTAPVTTADPEIVHTYTRAGIYNVTMTGTNWNGDTRTAFHSFEVTDKDIPRDVGFNTTGMKYSGAHPLTVQFQDQTPAQSNVIEWYWDFGDRTNAFFTTPTAPTHTYTIPGEYTVTLTVRNDMGVNEKIRVAYVVVV